MPDSSSRIAYHVFDILWLDGRSVMELPLDTRRALLKKLPLRAPLGRVPEVSGDEAVVKLTQSLTYVVGGKSERPKSATMIVRLKKPGLAQPGTTWQIESIR